MGRMSILAFVFVLFAFNADAVDISGRATVIDGDTLIINEQRIRLWGIDAPEMDTDAGVNAAFFLRGILYINHVICKPRGLDRYKRVVALCYANGKDVAQQMVDAGHARDWPQYSKGYYAK